MPSMRRVMFSRRALAIRGIDSPYSTTTVRSTAASRSPTSTPTPCMRSSTPIAPIPTLRVIPPIARAVPPPRSYTPRTSRAAMLAILVTTASAIVVEPSSELSGSLPRCDFEEASAGSLAAPDWVGVRGDWVSLINGLLEVVPPIAGAFIVLDRVGEEKFCATSMGLVGVRSGEVVDRHLDLGHLHVRLAPHVCDNLLAHRGGQDGKRRSVDNHESHAQGDCSRPGGVRQN